MVSLELQARVFKEIERCLAIAAQHFGRNFQFPKVTFDLRGTSAGRAYGDKWLISINPVLLVENEEEMVRVTVPHELAHLIDYEMYPETRMRKVIGYRQGRAVLSKRSVHGATWRRIMNLFGADPSRCHTMDVSNARVRTRDRHRFTYRCHCGHGAHVIGPKYHKNIQTGRRGYKFRACGHHIETRHFVGQHVIRAQQQVKP